MNYECMLDVGSISQMRPDTQFYTPKQATTLLQYFLFRIEKQMWPDWMIPKAGVQQNMNTLFLKKESMESESQEPPKTYFDLINMVGSKGRYQTVVFLLFCLNWFIAGILLLGTSFLFMNPEFQCQGTPSQIKACIKHICEQDPDTWSAHLKKPYVNSLATQFGPYLCDKTGQLNGLRMILYIGTFTGYLIFLFITDNFGRKVSVVAAWSVTTFGVFLVCIAQNMPMACVGLFLAGAGCESSIRISMAIFGQIVDYYRRQSYSVALQIAFGLSGVVVGLVYWIFREWRIVTIVFCGVPCLIELILLIVYLEETPKFLLTKQGVDKSLKSLNRIAKINQMGDNVITREHIELVLEEEECGDKFNFIITPFHLCKFKSLRGNTLGCSLMFMLITYLYFGPMIIVDRLGINPFVSQILISCSELFAYPFAFWFIQRLPRIRTGFVCFGLALIFNTVMIFVHPGEDCKGCAKGIVQIILVFASRFVISFYFAVFFLYVTEIFPLRARGLGFGIASAAGAIASSSGQFIFTELEDKQINPMIFFAVFSLLSIIVLSFMNETLNQPLQDQIKEILALKDEEKESHSARSQSSPRKSVSEGIPSKEIELVEQAEAAKKEGFSSVSEVEE